MYSDCTPVLQLFNIFWLDLTLLIGPGLRSGYGTPLDLVIWLLWSTSTKVNQGLPWSALVQGNQSQPGFTWSALVQGNQSQPGLALVFPGLRSGYGTPPDLVIWLLWSTSTKVNQELPWSALVQGSQSQPGLALVSSGPG